MLLPAWGRLLEYPGDDLRPRAAALLAELPAGSPPAAALRNFLEATVSLAPGALEEAYVQGFDLQPRASLYLAHHHADDDVEKARFILAMQRLLADTGVGREPGVTADHLPVVLAAYARLREEEPDGEGTAFLAALLRRAAGTVQEALADNVYVHLLRGLQALLDPPAPAAPGDGRNAR